MVDKSRELPYKNKGEWTRIKFDAYLMQVQNMDQYVANCDFAKLTGPDLNLYVHWLLPKPTLQ
jgi:hypothetical protein